MYRRAVIPFVAAALVLAAPARAETRFSDPAGDNGAAHDITVVAVTNDATQVVVTFPVPNPLPNLRQAGDQAWLLLIDADRDPSTGDAGDDVRVFQQDGAEVHVWNGGSWVDAPSNGISVRFELNSTSAGWRLQLPRTLLGARTGFDFRLVFAKLAGNDAVARDRAPDGGSWRYELVVAQCANGRDDDRDGTIDANDRGCSGTDDDVEGDERVTSRLRSASVTPTRARGGRPILVRARAEQLETGEPIATGSVVCTVRVGSRPLRISGRISSGVATCTLTAPRLARPTTVHGTMALVGSSVSVPFSFHAGRSRRA